MIYLFWYNLYTVTKVYTVTCTISSIIFYIYVEFDWHHNHLACWHDDDGVEKIQTEQEVGYTLFKIFLHNKFHIYYHHYMLYCIVIKLEEFVFYSRICIKILLMSFVYRIFNEGFVLNGCSSLCYEGNSKRTAHSNQKKKNNY